MNRLEFEKLELQVQQNGPSLKLYLQQIGVSYSTYHYWRRKCLVDRNSIKQELAPISFKQSVMKSSPEGQVPHGVAFCFPTVFVPTSGTGQKRYRWSCSLKVFEAAMFNLNDTMRYFLCSDRTDMRKSTSSLYRVIH